jgi:hypothetical protein
MQGFTARDYEYRPFLSDSFHHLKGVEFTFRDTVSAGGTLVGFFHHGAFSVFISDYFQYAAGASSGAKPAARTIFIDNMDNFLFCTLASVQNAQNIEQACRNYIQCIHFFPILWLQNYSHAACRAIEETGK